MFSRTRAAFALMLSAALAATPLQTAADTSASAVPLADVAGLWEASAFFGPDLRGPVTVERIGGGWRADLKGKLVAGRPDAAGRIEFDFGQGRTLTVDPSRRAALAGFWRQGQSPFDANSFITPVDLAVQAPGRWGGTVAPLDARMTLYLPVTVGADGGASAYVRNPERNAGRALRIESVRIEGGDVLLMGKPFGARVLEAVGRGRFDPDNGILSVYIPRVGQTYEFHRVDPGQGSGFYPRDPGAAPYRYTPPPARADGWPVGTLAEAGISQPDIERFIQTLATLPMESMSTSDVHAVLIARRGKLVLEEYFHGFDRDTLHDTRSAGKSVTATLFGAAMQAGHPLSLSTPVYATLGATPVDPRQATMTARHLLNQTSGYFCDDSNGDAPGAEDAMQGQREERDWYRFTLKLPMVSAPGGAAPVYCSVQPNLLGAVIARATGKPLERLFADLVAKPMGIGRYALNTQPTGEPYMGGGLYLEPRDFMKFAEVMRAGGTWQGRRVVSRDWASQSTAPLEQFGERRYGYLWWSQEYPYQGRTVRAFYAAGNGGQIAMAIPELELVICFMGGNYSDAAARIPQDRYVPEIILPAVGP